MVVIDDGLEFGEGTGGNLLHEGGRLWPDTGAGCPQSVFAIIGVAPVETLPRAPNSWAGSFLSGSSTLPTARGWGARRRGLSYSKWRR